MGIVYTNEGEKLILQWAIKDTTTPEDLSLHLYSNNVYPDADSIESDFVESTFSGYSSKSLTRATWNSTTTNGSGAGQITYPIQSWTPGESASVYGYYVKGVTSGTIIFAERFADVYALESGINLTITPKISMRSEN